MFLLGGCRPPDPLLFLGGFQTPRPPGRGPAAPRAPLHTERLRLSGSPFFLGTKILEAPNLWVRCRRRFFFSAKKGPIFLEALDLWVRCRRRLFFSAKKGPIFFGTDPPDLGTDHEGTARKYLARHGSTRSGHGTARDVPASMCSECMQLLYCIFPLKCFACLRVLAPLLSISKSHEYQSTSLSKNYMRQTQKFDPKN